MHPFCKFLEFVDLGLEVVYVICEDGHVICAYCGCEYVSRGHQMVGLGLI